LREYLSYLCGTKESAGSSIDMVALWTIALVIATLLLWYVAREQLTGISRATKADFIKKFGNEFFNDTTRDIMMLLDYDALSYDEKYIRYSHLKSPKVFQYFKINQNIVDQFAISTDKRDSFFKKGVYSAFEIDDFLLGYLEDIGHFERHGLLNIKDVNNFFGWYLIKIWENAEVNKYVFMQRQTDDEEIYQSAEYIYKKCISYNKCISQGNCLFWWRIKSYFCAFS
jgi:hypothetical protein